MEVVAQNFVRDPRAIREPGLLDAKCVKKIVDVLPADLPLELAGELVADEDYWQRRAEGRWEPPLETVDHGRSWKQLYFERNLQEAIEAHVAKASTSEEDEDPNRDALRRLLAFSKRWARSLKIVHAPGAVDVAALFECTAGSLVTLDLKYAARDVGADYDGANTLGMRLGCARALAKALEHAETLAHLGLSQNAIDDAKLARLAEGLAEGVGGGRGARDRTLIYGARQVRIRGSDQDRAREARVGTQGHAGQQQQCGHRCRRQARWRRGERQDGMSREGVVRSRVRTAACRGPLNVTSHGIP